MTLNSIKLALSKILAKLGEIATVDGKLFFTEDEFTTGIAVYVLENDEYVPAPDGEYELATGEILVVAAGIASEIKVLPEEDAPVAEEPTEETVIAEEEPIVEEAPIEEAPEAEDKIAALVAVVEALTERVAVLEEKIAASDEQLKKVCEMSAAKTVTEEIEQQPTVKTADSRFNKMLDGIKAASNK